jgi:hypothetical protein
VDTVHGYVPGEANYGIETSIADEAHIERLLEVA